MYFKKYMGRVVLWIWAELSYKLGPSWQGPSFMWAELAWAELVLGRVVRNSIPSLTTELAALELLKNECVML